MNTIDRFFKIRERNTTVKTEVTSGIVTFMTMAYVLVVQPGAICGYGPDASIVDVNGVVISKEAIVVSCALVSGLITLLMAFYANLPFALSTGMGSNFMFGALIQQQVLPFGGAMAMTLVSGTIFVALTARKVNGAILIGILAITVLGIPFGVTALPTTLAKIPDLSGLRAITFSFDWSAVFQISSVTLIFIVFCGDFFSTLGTVLGVSAKAGMMDENGNVKDIQKPFMVDAIGTCVGACTGNTTITTFIESSAGVQAGARTGLASVVTGVLMLAMFFFSPLVLMIPNAATGPALIFVGLLMISGICSIDFSDYTESFGPIVMILFTIFGGGIAGGIASGILAYIAIKVLSGRYKEVHPLMYLIAVPLVFYFIVK